MVFHRHSNKKRSLRVTLSIEFDGLKPNSEKRMMKGRPHGPIRRITSVLPTIQTLSGQNHLVLLANRKIKRDCRYSPNGTSRRSFSFTMQPRFPFWSINCHPHLTFFDQSL